MSPAPLSSPTAPRLADLDDAQREKVLSFKRKGEAVLRNSGLGYTIVRPGPLVEEAGGYKALVFDQGNRISQAISCADVADVCLKALHNPEARNKTFEVRVLEGCPGRGIKGIWSGDSRVSWAWARRCGLRFSMGVAQGVGTIEPYRAFHRCVSSTSRRRGWSFTSSSHTCQVRKRHRALFCLPSPACQAGRGTRECR